MDIETGPFRITAYKPLGEDDEDERCGYKIDNEDYAISMPHQCDAWVIAASPDRDQVIAEAKRFRDELDAAIMALTDASPPITSRP